MMTKKSSWTQEETTCFLIVVLLFINYGGRNGGMLANFGARPLSLLKWITVDIAVFNAAATPQSRTRCTQVALPGMTCARQRFNADRAVTARNSVAAVALRHQGVERATNKTVMQRRLLAMNCPTRRGRAATGDGGRGAFRVDATP